MARHVSQSWNSYFGSGTVTSMTLAFLVAFLGLGLPVLWRMRQVLVTARREDREAADAILILGRALDHDRPTPVFLARLHHGFELHRSGLAPRLIVAGGLTGTATRTEAQAGREVLLELGAPAAAVLCEDESCHTLDNLRHMRAVVAERGWRRLLVVSDPLHLARAAAFARGFSLEVGLSGARQAPPRPGSLGWWRRALQEACLLHWYHVGVAYSRAIRSERLLSRVS
ncbi:MAG TPA: YdcF family protein [Thermoanaerobaculia bacterium]|nr:YdcF family protein [Thermoanaerobaculia bacterium]